MAGVQEILNVLLGGKDMRTGGKKSKFKDPRRTEERSPKAIQLKRLGKEVKNSCILMNRCVSLICLFYCVCSMFALEYVDYLIVLYRNI